MLNRLNWTRISRLRRINRRADGDDAAGDPEQPFLEHLEDLRSALLKCAAWLAAGMLIALPLAPRILALIMRPMVAACESVGLDIRTTRVLTGLTLTMQISFWGGVVIGAPGMVASAVGFVFPGLTRRERRVASRALAAAAVLFVGGVLFCYWATLEPAMRMLIGINRWLGVEIAFVDLSDYVVFALRLLLAFGLAFELPMVVVALGAIGLVSSAFLAEKRRHAIVAIMALAMVLTPTMDPFTMLLMGVPLVLLYEICIWVVRAMERASAGAGAAR